MSDPLLLAIEAPATGSNRGWVQIARTTDGVAKNGAKKFEITSEDITAYAAHIRSNPDRIPVDYDHSYAEGGGTRAAGWVDAASVEARADGTELWAQVDWTPSAADAIRAGEFRYFSPEIAFKSNKDGVLRKAAEFLAGALTNRPFFKDMAPVRLSEAHPIEPTEGVPMSKVIATSLGLAEDADEKTIAAAIKTRDDAVTAAEKKATEAAEKLTETQAELDALRATASDADKELTGLKTTVATLLKGRHDDRVKAMLDKGITDTKMDPAERDSLASLAEKAGIDAVQALLDARTARPLNDGKGHGGEGLPAGGSATATSDGRELPVIEGELAAAVDAHILSLKLDHPATVEEYLAAVDHVRATVSA